MCIVSFYNDFLLQWHLTNGKAFILLPDKATVKSQHAWALKLTQK